MTVAELRKRLMNTAVADCLRAADGGAILGSAILALLVIDYLSVLREKYPASTTGNQWKVGRNYKSFVNDYLTRVNPKYNGDTIYWLRCALAHSYARATGNNVKGYALKHLDSAFHLSGPPDIVNINTDSFVADVVIAANLFLKDVEGEAGVEARADLLLRIKGELGEEVPSTFKEMQGALAALDASELDDAQLRADIASRYSAINAGGPEDGPFTSTLPVSGI